MKVLSIDGGGIKGAYCLHLMKNIEQEFSINFSKNFQVFVGTSVGGIVATCLAVGFKPEEILDLFSDFFEIANSTLSARIPKIIVKMTLKWIIKSLFKRFDELFAEKKFALIRERVFLPVYDHTVKRNTHFGINSKLNIDDVSISDVLKAISSDVRFAKPHRIHTLDKNFCDAGIFAYDPSQYFVRSSWQNSFKRIEMLSIGSGMIENFSSVLNVGHPFDEVYDSFLYEQFYDTRFFFDVASKASLLTYYRISEFETGARPKSVSELIELAKQRVEMIEKDRIEAFRSNFLL